MKDYVYEYDYYQAVMSDVEDYLNANYPDYVGTFTMRDFDWLYDELLNSDNVTGNASGSYTFSYWKASEYLCHNSALLGHALTEFYGEKVPVDVVTSSEACDVLIRCYLLPSILSSILEVEDLSMED